MRVLITGAGGFLGRGLASALAERPGDLSRLVLTDIALPGQPPAGAQIVTGDLGESDFLDNLLQGGFDLVFHLASLPGAFAETAPDEGYRANLLVSLELARRLAAKRRGARLVFTSSIAVYCDLAGRCVTEHTPTDSVLSYGTHKRMTEIFLADMARRRELGAISLRLPGLVARPPGPSQHGSAFMSLIFHEIAAGRVYRCPVPADASCWWMSRAAAVSALRHAASLGPASLTVLQPPVLHAAIGDVAAAVERFTGRRGLIEWGEDVHLTRLFGAMPPLDAGPAQRLGFRADADLDALARAALAGDCS